LYAHARMSMVTLINLSFIEVVFLYILPCNGGHIGQQASRTSACGRPSAWRLSTEP